jgi:hypothetical protein
MRVEITLAVHLSVLDARTGQLREPADDAEMGARVVVAGALTSSVTPGVRGMGVSANLASVDSVTVDDVLVTT